MSNLPKIVLTDIDGVWTDGGMYYDQTGNEFKKFNVKDGAGVIYLKLLKIPVVIVTGEDTEIVRRRAEKLKITELFMGVKNKVKVVEELKDRLKIDFEDMAYIGDDINDLNLLKKVGFSATTKDASDYLKTEVDYVTASKGGEGAFREFVEEILIKNKVFSNTLDRYREINLLSSKF